MVRISVVTPTFNSEKTIERNINSVINQSYKDFEHIIVDNNSKDSTLSLINKIYKDNGLSGILRTINEADNGISDAFNKGIKAAKGDIVGILNSDDYYFDSSVFKRIISAFEDPEILFTHGDIKFIDNIYGTNIRKPLLCDIREAMPYNHPTMFFRKIVYEQYGIFEASYKYAMDYEFVCRLEKRIPEFRTRGRYLAGEPLVVQLAGGHSWQNESAGIEEVKNALIFHQLWNNDAEMFYRKRIKRTKIKEILHSLKLDFVIKIWRNKKWGNKVSTLA
jgi:glycosyltransferase involved in cell wall biosynthesis